MTNNTYSLFHRNGEYDGNVSGPFQFVIAPTLAAWDGYHYEGEYDNTYYFHDGEPKKRPESGITLEGCVLKNTPRDTLIIIGTEEYHVDSDTDVSLDFPFPGEYIIHVIPPFPYLPLEFKYENNPQT